MLAARAVSMQYPGTLALDRVDFEVQPGRVNALIGENGAGKSTLMRILAGEEQPTGGRIERDVPVAMIHQELNLLPKLSVADNIFLGRERTRRGVLDRAAEEGETRALMARLGLAIDPRAPVDGLPLGQQQMVEIAKALAREARVLIMDEPTSALSAAEIAVLFGVIRDLKAHGVGIVYISHRLEELLGIGDRVTVLRDGRVVAEAEAAGLTTAWLVEKITGRTLAAHERAAAPASPGRELLRRGQLAARAGEVVGLYGLMGAGRTELLESLAAEGCWLVPEDCKSAGVVPTMSVLENITLATLRGLYLSPAKERRRAAPLAAELGVRIDGPITRLSGGNQQKAVLARYLLAAPQLLLLDEPTRGVDVAARAEIHAIIRRLAAQGMAVVFASSELKEVLALADRVLVMARGRITAEFEAARVTEHELVAAAAPGGGGG
jgi:erythritol transport system ATP-binding protein